MHTEIKSFLENYTETFKLPRANDVHLISFLAPFVDCGYSENQIDELVNFLCSNYPRLQDISSQDISSLVHNTVQFVVNYRQGGNILVNANHNQEWASCCNFREGRRVLAFFMRFNMDLVVLYQNNTCLFHRVKYYSGGHWYVLSFSLTNHWEI